MDKVWKGLISLGILAGMILGSITYFAKAADLQQLINIMARKELREDLAVVDDRIWGYEQIKTIQGLSEADVKTLRQLRVDRCIILADMKVTDKACE